MGMLAAAACLGLLALIALTWFIRGAWFHRDPDHTQTEQDDRVVKSPVYGRIAYVRRVAGGMVTSEKKGDEIEIGEITKAAWPEEYPQGDGWLIGIAMTALDVHFQYAPVPSEIGEIQHNPAGRNLPMFDMWEYVRVTWFRRAVQLWAKRHVFENERQTMWLRGRRVELALVLIADKFVDKITTFVKRGDHVRAGGKLSFIGRGSQVDVVICGHPDLKLNVREGQTVSGPRTVLARVP